jgi:16S rRNA (cytidine1402-2'-O)-methyltransferase
LEEILPGTLYLVSTPIGHLGDITYRAVYILNSVSLIAAEDTRVSRILLNNYDIKNSVIAFHSYNQRKQTPALISNLKAGESIALISDAGTPGISDPAFILVKECIAQGIRIIPIPGASAILAALTPSGLATNRFVFEGFLPVKKGRQTRIAKLVNEERTIIIYESPHRLKKTSEALFDALGNRKCSVARELTKKFEEIYHGYLSEFIDHLEHKPPRGEYVLIIEGKNT